MEKLTVEEDAELRRLNALAMFGDLGPRTGALYRELRARDRRLEVREPVDLIFPAQRDRANQATMEG